MADGKGFFRLSVGRLLRALARASFGPSECRDAEAIRLRELGDAEAECRRALGRSIAASLRIASRHRELARALTASREEAERAGAADRGDLARAAVERQLDVEAELASLGDLATEAQAEIDVRERDLVAIEARHRAAETAAAEARGALGRSAGLAGLPTHRASQDRARVEIARLRREAAVADRLKRLESRQD